MNLSFHNFSNGRVLVIGDVMLDRFWFGSTSRISPEAPVPVVHVKDSEERPGGAANVALNVSSLGSEVKLLGIVGSDEQSRLLKKILKQRGVSCCFQTEKSVSTCTKLRILSHQQQLIRLDFESDYCHVDTASLFQIFSDFLHSTDVVVLSDYGKGTLCDAQHLIKLANDADKNVLVDPKGKDFSKYRGATLITPNLSEFEAVVGPCLTEDEITEKGMNLIKSLGLDGLLVTRGEHGMTLLEKSGEPFHLPTQAKEVYDVTGAGDTVIGVVAAGLASGRSVRDAVKLANAAAGIVVGKLGTATVSPVELQKEINKDIEIGFGILSEDELVAAVARAKAQGERVVMTNGCFDILHYGHISCLEQASKLGDRLIIAVNSDESVKRLKGSDRPINNLNHRMAVLEALKFVDWVVSFAEDTPEKLYYKILPDVICKGGDYSNKEIVGRNCVKANGGEVVALEYKDGCSSTSIIKRLKNMDCENKIFDDDFCF